MYAHDKVICCYVSEQNKLKSPNIEKLLFLKVKDADRLNIRPDSLVFISMNDALSYQDCLLQHFYDFTLSISMTPGPKETNQYVLLLF